MYQKGTVRYAATGDNVLEKCLFAAHQRLPEQVPVMLIPHPGAGRCIMLPDEVEALLVRGKESGCTEALFTFGEHPEEEPGFSVHILKKTGYDAILDYCEAMCGLAYGTILPHTNAGILTYDEMKRLRTVNASMGLMLETTARDTGTQRIERKVTRGAPCDDG